MTVFYKLRQDNQERSKYKGQWFAHTVNLGTIETDELARIIERNCSVKRSDVLAVPSACCWPTRTVCALPASAR